MQVRVTDPLYPLLDNCTCDPRLSGLTGVLNSGAEKDSASRADMFSSNLAQILPIAKPDFPLMYTGWEYHLGKYRIDPSERDQDVVILAVIPRYQVMSGDNQIKRNPSVTVIYKGMDDGKIGYFTMANYYKGANEFGHRVDFINQSLLQKGSFLSKDVKLTTDASVEGHMTKLGINANVAYMTLNTTIEDAMVVSRSAADKLTSLHVQRHGFEVKPNQHPLNLYGDNNFFKFFPDIGEYVNGDGILCAFRSIKPEASLIDAMPRTMRQPSMMHDFIVNAPPGAEIIDIEVYLGAPTSEVSWSAFNQIEKYLINTKNYWKQIYDTYTQHVRGSNGLTHAFNTLVTTSIARLSNMGVRIPGVNTKRRVDLLTKNDNRIDFLYMEITFAMPRLVREAHKITDRHGAKGVICAVVPDDEMPVDDFGIRADLVVDPISPVKRMNEAQPFESSIARVNEFVKQATDEERINRVGEFVRRKIASVYKEPKNKNPGKNSTDNALAWKIYTDYLRDVSPYYLESVEMEVTTPSQIDDHLHELVHQPYGIHIHMLPFSKHVRKDDFVTKLYEKWQIPVSPVTFTTYDEQGNKIKARTEHPVEIGNKQIFVLSKVPTIISSGIAITNQNGIPIRPSSHQAKMSSPISTNPIRFVGEDEDRVLALDVAMKAVVRAFTLMSNSPFGTRVMLTTILTSVEPMKIQRMPISDEDLIKTSGPMALMRHVASVTGVHLAFTRATPEDMLMLTLPPGSMKLADSTDDEDVELTLEPFSGVEDKGEVDDDEGDDGLADEAEDIGGKMVYADLAEDPHVNPFAVLKIGDQTVFADDDAEEADDV